PEPCLGRCAGSRLTVIRCCGQRSPELTIAARTRSRDSCTEASGKPETTRLGRPAATSASTTTSCPATPTTATECASAHPMPERPPQVPDPGGAGRLGQHAHHVEAHLLGTHPADREPLGGEPAQAAGLGRDDGLHRSAEPGAAPRLHL